MSIVNDVCRKAFADAERENQERGIDGRDQPILGTGLKHGGDIRGLVTLFAVAMMFLVAMPVVGLFLLAVWLVAWWLD
jgi:hypothetical protein